MRVMKNTITKNKITAVLSGKRVKNFIPILMNNKNKHLNQWL